MTKTNNPTSSKTPYLAVIVILVLVVVGLAYLYMQLQSAAGYNTSKSQLQEIQNKYNTSKSQLQEIQNKYNTSKSQLQEIQNNQRTPMVTHPYQNKELIVPALTNSIQFYNSTYNLYNNYTVASSQNYTLNFKYDGYLIINIQNVSDEYNNKTQPAVGTFGIQVYSQSLEVYYSYINSYIVPIACVFCRNNNAINLGWAFYPENYSATYLAPVKYGNVTLSFTNTNNYPIKVNFSVTYVGENYTNLIPITSNYST